MKIYQHWVIEKAILNIDGQVKEIRVYGGSNISAADASLQARQKVGKIQSKIQGAADVFEDYEVEIREEIVRALEPGAVITRNRYGAQVLNVENMLIMDIDEPKSSFWDMFKKLPDAKTRMLNMVREQAQKPAYRDCAFRIYETSKGLRVIVLGRSFDPRAESTASIMKAFNSDAFYTYMCQKQDCFRARLTPKPSRIKVKGLKIKFPRDPLAEAEFRRWLQEYEYASRNYSVTKFIEQIGPPATLPEPVRLHDERCGAFRTQNLA